MNHDILMDRLARRIPDKAVLRLIRRYLQAGIMDGGVKPERDEGTPQGGPLSPLLANVLLDDVDRDRDLERRGHCFARYADDCNVYVRSRRAGERVLAGLRRLYAKLHLQVNETKTAVASAFQRKFLPGWKGYFQLAQTPGVFRELDEWLRHRLRALHLKHWKRGPTMYKHTCRSRKLMCRSLNPPHQSQLNAPPV